MSGGRAISYSVTELGATFFVVICYATGEVGWCNGFPTRDDALDWIRQKEAAEGALTRGG